VIAWVDRPLAGDAVSLLRASLAAEADVLPLAVAQRGAAG
jgi:hypothetical protein